MPDLAGAFPYNYSRCVIGVKSAGVFPVSSYYLLYRREPGVRGQKSGAKSQFGAIPQASSDY
ncbi:hypothetical protein NST99_08440 [Paenibacillus sp. FSL L8-0470]|uniref:hypothetical protein n=1 Tax=Paenibacillus sp. FSL L8-0470 TaxID=2954688 RepID=UPI0030F7FB2C